MTNKIDTSPAAIETLFQTAAPWPWSLKWGRNNLSAKIFDRNGFWVADVYAADTKNLLAIVHGLEMLREVAAERDRLVVENARLRDAVALVRAEMNTRLNGGGGWMARFEEIVKGYNNG